MRSDVSLLLISLTAILFRCSSKGNKTRSSLSALSPIFSLLYIYTFQSFQSLCHLLEKKEIDRIAFSNLAATVVQSARTRRMFVKS